MGDDEKWALVDQRNDGYAVWRPRDGLRVIVSFSKELDGETWGHLSCSYPDRLPDWETLKEVKTLFFREDTTALIVLPPKKKYVNINPYVHHLWVCLSKEVVPDFTQGGDSI